MLPLIKIHAIALFFINFFSFVVKRDSENFFTILTSKNFSAVLSSKIRSQNIANNSLIRHFTYYFEISAAKSVQPSTKTLLSKNTLF